jgi:RimJ/RimL family protein N-acetyltransferase
MSNNLSFTLRPFTKDDVESIAYNANNRKIWEGVRDIIPYPYSENDAEIFIEYAMSAQKEIVKAIDVDGKAVGVIGLHLKEDVFKLNAEIGYWIGVDYQGKGIVTKAIAQIVSLVFNEHKLLRVYAEVFSNNSASARVLIKNGFIPETRLKDAVVKDNQIVDLLIFSKINSNFNKKIYR